MLLKKTKKKSYLGNFPVDLLQPFVGHRSILRSIGRSGYDFATTDTLEYSKDILTNRFMQI